MAVTRIVLNRKNIRDLLKSPKVAADLRRRAENIARAAGPGHRVESEIGKNRARAAVITDSIDAMVAEAQNRNLTRAIDAGRR